MADDGIPNEMDAAMGFTSFGKQKPPRGGGAFGGGEGGGPFGASAGTSSNVTPLGERQPYIPPPPPGMAPSEATSSAMTGFDMPPPPGVGDDYSYRAAGGHQHHQQQQHHYQREGYVAPGGRGGFQGGDFDYHSKGGPRNRGGRGHGGGRGGRGGFSRGHGSHPYSRGSSRGGGGHHGGGGDGGHRGGRGGKQWHGYVDKEFGESYFKKSMLKDPWAGMIQQSTGKS